MKVFDGLLYTKRNYGGEEAQPCALREVMQKKEGNFTVEKKTYSSLAWTKFILCNLIGIFMFFVTIPYNGKSTIPLDVLCTVICDLVGNAQQWVVLAVCIVGALLPFIKKTWNQNRTSIVFTILKLIGVICAGMFVTKLGPREWLESPHLLPFLFGLGQSLVVLVPIGSIFLVFLTSHGLMEFVGVFVRPFMRKIWKTPGSSAIDAVASFVGSYSVALLITDGLYQKGAYTKKEAAIIATGFSTVSSTFMVTVASTLDLMEHWNLYFWSTLVITFTVTAFTVRMFPLNRFPDEYCEGAEPKPENVITQNRFQTAIHTALTTAENSGSLPYNIWHTFLGGLQMTCTIVPSIMSVGLIGMLLALYTPIFNVIAFLFYPFTALMQVPEALIAAQALATSIAEMYLPCAFVVECSFSTRYVVGVGCISELLFFSAVIPCILSTSIPVKIPQMLMLWVERVMLSILLAGVVALILF